MWKECLQILENHESWRCSKRLLSVEPEPSTAGIFQLAEGQYTGGGGD